MAVAAPATFSLRGDHPGSASGFMDPMVEETPRPPVPDHLLESKLYVKLGSNASVAAEPGIIHFRGYEIGKSHHQVLKLVNVSGDVSNLHIIPPQSRHFTIRYRKANRMVPGLALTVNIQFIADEWRYYYDCIRIHCKGDETLLVPLHAFPVLELLDFPSHVGLSAAAPGQSALHVLPLRCSSPVAFEFSIFCSQPHKDFDVSPTSGIVSAGSPVEVTVTYSPSSYGTTHIRLELLISEFNAKPRVCVFSGTCSPKLSTRTQGPEDLQIPPKGRPQPPQKLPYGVSRKKRHLHTLQQHTSQVIEFQNLPNPQRPDLREGLTSSDKEVKTRREKETRFQRVIQENVAEEEANQLRWQVHLGCGPISAEQRRLIIEDRQMAEADYQVMRGRPDLAAEYRMEAVVAGCLRVLRGADDVRGAEEAPRMQPQFDLYLNDLWADRTRALRRFQQAARTVLIRGRVNARRSNLRKLLQCLRSEGGAASDSSDDVAAPSPRKLLLFQFPSSPAEPDGSMLGDPAPLPPGPAAAPLRHQLCFQDLKVPQYFRLMEYRAVRSFGASSGYPPRHLLRPLRRGAEDELLPETTSPPEDPAPELGEEPAGGHMLLRPPQTLLNPPNLHPMHVFNPAPGLVAFKRPLSYSEVDLEYHMCPLPKYLAQQDPGRKEIIRGVMTWKRFPAVALSIPAPVSDGRKPRWCDPFSVDLLPASAPPALGALPAQDKENIVPRDRDEADCKVWLTPDMLRAEFTALQSSASDDAVASCQQPEEPHVPDEGNSMLNKVQGNLRQMQLLCHRLILAPAGGADHLLQ